MKQPDKPLIHLDLFSGIGGFAYATDQVWDNVEHIFCEWDDFCQKVLAKHWPESEIYGDIRQLITDTDFKRRVHGRPEKQPAKRRQQVQRQSKPSAEPPFLLTGGFPCQPFSAAGVRRGTNDERYLWPAMLEVIRLTEPTWVIAENVGGILTWQEGLVFEQVCSDLEASGYEVQPFVIPAAAVGAPHRRDRVWFVGHSQHPGQHGAKNTKGHSQGSNRHTERQDEFRQPQGANSLRQTASNTRRKYGQSRGSDQSGQDPSIGSSKTTETERYSADDANAIDTGLEGFKQKQAAGYRGQSDRNGSQERWSWGEDWAKVAAELCSVDDGLPVELDGFKLSKSKHRAERLKSLGNAIVPQVAMEIMRGMTI